MRQYDTRIEILRDEPDEYFCQYFDQGELIAKGVIGYKTKEEALKVARKVWKAAPVYLIEKIRNHGED